MYPSKQMRSLLDGCLTGDQSANLEWRIMTGGEFPAIHMPKTVVILIGTNDLTYADCHDDQQEILDAVPGVVDRCAMPDLAAEAKSVLH